MPIFQKMTLAFNESIGNPEQAQEELFEVSLPASLAEAFVEHRVITTDAERAFVESLPDAIQGALLGAVAANLRRGHGAVPITLAWRPGYDFGFELYDAPGTPESKGGITMIVQTRYPMDTHPATIGS